MGKQQRILIVDDEPEINDLIYRSILEKEGYSDILTLTSIDQLMQTLNASLHPENKPVDLILMDVIMPEKDGIQGIQEVKRFDMFQDIPVLMLTAIHDKQLLKQAFESGAIDYITKPVDPVEFIARVGSALRLKDEIDRRKSWENELLEMTRGLMASNSRLEQASFQDPITGLLNRKAFDKRIREDWTHCYVQKVPMTLMLIEVQNFRSFNEHKGALQGDHCLQAIAEVLSERIQERVMLSRFGGALFALLYPGYDPASVEALSAGIAEDIASLQIAHPDGGLVSVAIGVASVDPAKESGPESLLQQADLALAHDRIDS